MTYGVTDQGFILKRLTDLKSELEVAYGEIFGEIDISSDSVFGQMIGIQARFLAEPWEQLEKVYNLLSILSSTGVNLDRLVALNVITRLPATKTRVYVQLKGDEGTIIPQGFTASISVNGKQFELETQTTITQASLNKGVCEIITGIVDKDYKVTINDQVISFTAVSTDKTAIALGLKNAINSALSTVVKASIINGAVFKIESLTQEIPFKLEVPAECSDDVSITEIYTPGIFYATEPGKIAAPAGTVTEIETPVAGLDSISNMWDGELGRETESDDELRIRREKSLKITGASNLEAIKAKLEQEIENVTAVIAYENDTDEIDSEGRPPHSMEFVVQNGDEQEIASKLWLTKAGGIQLVGNANNGDGYQVVDSQGYSHTVRFSRPVTKYAHLRITVLSYYDEEQFPSNGLSIIKEKTLSFANNLGIGQDVILQRFAGPIYTYVPGIASLKIEGALTNNPGDFPLFTEYNLVLGSAEIADFDSTRITVILP